MKSQVLVSIGMPVRNNASTLKLALRSLLRQTFTDWELILIDDGSTDATVDIARLFTDERIKLIEEPVSRGLAHRLNQAIDLAQGRYFARMDGDDVCFPDRFARQVAYLEEHPETDLLGSGGVVFSGDGQVLGVRPVRTTHDEICSDPWSGFYLAHPSWMGRTAWFRTYRYDDRALKSQDYDLLLRAYARSRFAALPELLIGYREERLARRKSLMSRWQTTAAQCRFAKRAGIWRPLPAAVLGQLGKGLVDLLVIGTGLERKVLSHRALPIMDADSRRWKSLWCGLTQDDSCKCAE
jgi:glycosyltransferase involved in cell wall biosynthesis